MNIAAGSPLERGRYLSQLNPEEYIKKLMDKNFNGYVCVGIHGKTGLEEGTMVFYNGEIVSSDYEYYKYNKSYKAEEGIKRSLNALFAPIGILDSFSLTSYQIQLILTLNEECNLKENITNDSLKLQPKFLYKYEQELTKGEVEEETPKEALLKRLGLTRMIGAKTTKAGLVKKMEKEHKDAKMFEKVMKSKPVKPMKLKPKKLEKKKIGKRKGK